MPAKAGHRVIFVDTDFRRSVVADLLKLENTPGLLDVMTGEAYLDEAIHKDAGTGLDVIVSGVYHGKAVHAFATGGSKTSSRP